MSKIKEGVTVEFTAMELKMIQNALVNEEIYIRRNELISKAERIAWMVEVVNARDKVEKALE